MANWKLNRRVLGRQIRTFVVAGGFFLLMIAIIIALLADGRPKKTAQSNDTIDLTGIVNESFTEANADSALTAQQTELESLKNQIGELVKSVNAMSIEHEKQLKIQASDFQKQIAEMAQSRPEKSETTENTNDTPPELKTVQNPEFWRDNTYAMNTQQVQNVSMNDARPVIHTVSFRQKRRARPVNYLDPAHYIPSNTSVRAVVLGGVDADASVTSKTDNNGAMLFKFLEDARLPNGQRARLTGCRVSAHTYGDISSERAYPALYRLSCAWPGQPIIDKAVTGWVFFNGKVGIKGKPLMRDGKVMQWAGLGGMISSGASVAQYAQSVQQFGPLGASTFVPSANILPYAALGGAAKTGDSLSQYYIQRAEQYHPVIQVGANNVVTIVFKDGFYLEPDEDRQQHALNQAKSVKEALIAERQSEDASENMNFSVPPEVLGRIDHMNAQSRTFPGDAR